MLQAFITQVLTSHPFRIKYNRLNSFLAWGSDFVNLVLGLIELACTGPSALAVVVVVAMTWEVLYMSQSVEGGSVLSGEDHMHTVRGGPYRKFKDKGAIPFFSTCNNQAR